MRIRKLWTICRQENTRGRKKEQKKNSQYREAGFGSRILLFVLCIFMGISGSIGSVHTKASQAPETEGQQKETQEAVSAQPKDLTLYAKSAVLMDADSGRVLYEKNGYEHMPNASTTKIMTCILALEQGNFEDKVKVSSYAASMPRVRLGMSNDDTFLLKDLLY